MCTFSLGTLDSIVSLCNPHTCMRTFADFTCHSYHYNILEMFLYLVYTDIPFKTKTGLTTYLLGFVSLPPLVPKLLSNVWMTNSVGSKGLLQLTSARRELE